MPSGVHDFRTFDHGMRPHAKWKHNVRSHDHTKSCMTLPQPHLAVRQQACPARHAEHAISNTSRGVFGGAVAIKHAIPEMPSGHENKGKNGKHFGCKKEQLKPFRLRCCSSTHPPSNRTSKLCKLRVGKYRRPPFGIAGLCQREP